MSGKRPFSVCPLYSKHSVNPEPWQIIEKVFVEIRCAVCARRRPDMRPPIVGYVERHRYGDGRDTRPRLFTLRRGRPHVVGPGPDYAPRPYTEFRPMMKARLGRDVVVVEHRNPHREMMRHLVTEQTVTLGCRSAACKHRPKRNVSKLITEALSAYRRGEREIFV